MRRALRNKRRRRNEGGACLFVLYVVSAFAEQQTQSIQSIQQSSKGTCAVNLAGIQGNVQISSLNCPGVDPKALQGLERHMNELLRTQKLQVSDVKKEANDWRTKFLELQGRLAEMGINSELAKQAEQLIKDGKLDEAGEQLDKRIRSERAAVDALAEDYYARGKVFDLKFEPLHALSQYEQAYKISADNLEYGAAYAAALMGQNDFAKAEGVLIPVRNRVEELSKTDAAKYAPRLASTLDLLGLIYSFTGRKKDAEEILQKALVLQKGLPDPDMNDLAGTLSVLYALYESTGKQKEAEGALQERLNLYQRLAKSNPTEYEQNLAGVKAELGSFYAKSNRLEEAEKADNEAVDLSRRLARSNAVAHESGLAFALTTRGSLYLKMERLTEAENDDKEALEILQRLAKNNPGVAPLEAVTLSDLAHVYAHEQRLKEAEADFQNAVEIYVPLAKLNPDEFEDLLATSEGDLALFYERNKRCAEADAAYQEELGVRRRRSQANPGSEPILAKTLGKIADFYDFCDKPQLAEQDYKEAIQIYEKLAATKPAQFVQSVARNDNDLGVLYFRHAQLDKAEDCYKKSIKQYERISKAYNGALIPELAQTWSNLALVYEATQRWKEAGDAYSEAVKILRPIARTHPSEYGPNLVKTLKSLARVCRQSQQVREAQEFEEEASRVSVSPEHAE
jgi:tetratricopeptide (TPR) repeat protein